ncbi:MULTISPECIES: DUF6234 family protein [unclassified Streptomyces]|uniref:DUF6234 family protein n=1 Tax=unclassified Streptomyces TaxID=2593676 RepID=UPI0035DF65A0
MRFEPSSPAPHSPRDGCRTGRPSDAKGDGFEAGCISLILLLIEIPVALLLGLTAVLSGWGRPGEQARALPMDWAPILLLGGFTVTVLVIGVLFLRSAHPFAGAVQLLIAAVALVFTIAAWHDQYERAHPSPPPTKSGMPHAPPQTDL